MAVYSFGSNPQVWAKPIAGGISAYRKAKAAEEEAARKAAKEAQAIYEKARKDREKAKKDAIKAQEEADKLSREQSGGLVTPTGGSDLSISDTRAPVGDQMHTPLLRGEGWNHVLQEYKRRRALTNPADKPTGTVMLNRASAVDPKSQPSVKFLRGYSERYGEAPDPYQGYASPGHYKASADRFGDLSYSDQTPLSAAAAKRIMTIEELAALKGSKGKTTTPLPTLPGQDLTFDAYNKQRLRGFGGRKNTFPGQWSKARGFAGHQADEFYGVDDRIRENKREREVAAQQAIIARESQIADASDFSNYDEVKYSTEKRIEEAQKVAATKQAKDNAAWWAKQRALEAAETKAAMARLGAGDITKEFGGTDNVTWSNKRRAELFNLTDAAAKIRGEAIDAGTVPIGGWPLPQYLASQVGFPPKQGLTFERIQEIETDFEAYEKDAVTESIMDIARQQALYKGGEATTRSEFIKIQGLVADGKLTVVQIKDNADGTMDASPVSEDGLREQLRATDPTYIDAGPNPVVKIGGVLYEKFGDQFFPLEEMTTDEGMDIGGLPQLRYDSRRMTPPRIPAFDSLNASRTPITTTGSDSYARSIFRS